MEENMEDKQIRAQNTKIEITYNQLIILILTLGLALRIFLVLNYGNKLTTNADDRNYIFGAISLLKNNVLVYGIAWPEQHSMIIMPGIIVLLSTLFRIFSYDQGGMIAIRIFFGILGCVSIYGMSLIAKDYFNKKIAIVVSILLALFPPIVLQHVMIFTETPMILAMTFFIYFTLKYCETRSNRHFIYLLVCYMISIMFRNTFALIPLTFLPYFVIKRFPIKELIIKGIYAVLILVLFLTPWWVRNYRITGDFVATTGGLGDPLLGGTLTGIDYPEAEMTLDEYRNYFNNPDEENSLYNRMKREEILGKERMLKWWKEDKKGFCKNILFIKPIMSIRQVDYPITIFDINKKFMNDIYIILLLFAITGALIVLTKKWCRQIGLVFILIIMYSLLLCGIFLPFVHYNAPAIPFIYCLSAVGIYEMIYIVNKIRKAILLKITEKNK